MPNPFRRQNPSTGATRVLMRRDKILKVCANHVIKPDMTIDFRSDDKDRKHLTWRAVDYTEEPKLEQFCCKSVTSLSVPLSLARMRWTNGNEHVS